MTYPDSPQVVVGTRTLLVAMVELKQSTQSGRLPEVAAGQPFWAVTRDTAGLVAAGLAAYAPTGTQLRPEPPFTVNQVPGLARGTSNPSPEPGSRPDLLPWVNRPARTGTGCEPAGPPRVP